MIGKGSLETATQFDERFRERRRPASRRYVLQSKMVVSESRLTKIEGSLEGSKGETSLRGETKSLRRAIEDLKEETKSLRGAIEVLKYEVEDLKAETKSLRGELKGLKGEIEILKWGVGTIVILVGVVLAGVVKLAFFPG